MLIIEIKKGESVDIALKKLKNKFRKVKIAEELRDRMYYDKPSVKKRETKQNAVYKQKLRDQEEND